MTESIFTRGALRSRLVARLAGSSPQQLGRWHRSDLIVATVLPGGRGLRRLYSWAEYSKVRAAVQLLEQNLPRHRLRPNLIRLEQEVPGWYRLPLLAYQKHVIVPTDVGLGYTILDKQMAQADFITAAELRPTRTSDSELDRVIEVVRAIQSEGPLGALREFGEHVTMDPAVNGGSPVVIGTRLETAMIAAIHAKSFQQIPEIAERFDLSEHQVECAIAFERELSRPDSVRALSA
ncbi:MAG: DUF433 domain-containing protein [Chloroflexi bacterium]|nr:DUF433 domain-containing protein [Chloroflexota bacterium]